mmetsp:Transcript_2345/g.5534  ORF Transcript_2345/g.5534 Transcript_2345/m.5534 type:complete len:243 (+) Transcript_2345:1984-2712(+)
MDLVSSATSAPSPCACSRGSRRKTEVPLTESTVATSETIDPGVRAWLARTISWPGSHGTASAATSISVAPIAVVVLRVVRCSSGLPASEPKRRTEPPETASIPLPTRSPLPSTGTPPRFRLMSSRPRKGSSSLPATSIPPFSTVTLPALITRWRSLFSTSRTPRMASSSRSEVLESRIMCFPPGMRTRSPASGRFSQAQELDHLMGPAESGHMLATNVAFTWPMEVLIRTKTLWSPGLSNVK